MIAFSSAQPSVRGAFPTPGTATTFYGTRSDCVVVASEQTGMLACAEKPEYTTPSASPGTAGSNREPNSGQQARSRLLGAHQALSLPHGPSEQRSWAGGFGSIMRDLGVDKVVCTGTYKQYSYMTSHPRRRGIVVVSHLETGDHRNHILIWASSLCLPYMLGYMPYPAVRSMDVLDAMC